MTQRPTRALININNLKANYLALKGLVPHDTLLLAVVKANAYGHGDKRVAVALQSVGCANFAVATLTEGLRLRESNITGRIMVLGPLFAGQEEAFCDADLTPVLFDIDRARTLDRAAQERGEIKKVHVKIDTGMGRLGLLPAEIEQFFSAFKKFKALKLEGLVSHYSDMQAVDKFYSEGQLGTFLASIERVRSMGLNPKIIHMSNSASIVDFKGADMRMVRAGLMLYGVYPTTRLKDKIALKPVMELVSSITSIKKLPTGCAVSYGRGFVTKRPSLIATVPAGYADGLPVRLSNNGEALVRGRRVRITGAVCMDMTMLDVTDVEGVSIGDEAVFIGERGTESISALDIAEKTGTISYEIVCGIGARVSRVEI